MVTDLVMDIGLVAAYFLPILFLMAFIDRAGKKYLIYLFWGFLASVPVLFFYLVIAHACPENIYADLTVSPLLEEFFKALPIIIPALIGIKNNDDDLLVCAMASGIGFSIIENVFHVFPNLLPLILENNWNALFTLITTSSPSQETVLLVFFLSFSSSLLHGCTCGIIGYGIVLIRNFDRHALPTLLFGFYTIAVTVHAIFNLMPMLPEPYTEYGFIIDFIFPVILFFLLHACYHVDVPVLFKKSVGE